MCALLSTLRPARVARPNDPNKVPARRSLVLLGLSGLSAGRRSLVSVAAALCARSFSLDKPAGCGAWRATSSAPTVSCPSPAGHSPALSATQLRFAVCLPRASLNLGVLVWGCSFADPDSRVLAARVQDPLCCVFGRECAQRSKRTASRFQHDAGQSCLGHVVFNAAGISLVCLAGVSGLRRGAPAAGCAILQGLPLGVRVAVSLCRRVALLCFEDQMHPTRSNKLFAVPASLSL
jgi:hypothetical protein